MSKAIRANNPGVKVEMALIVVAPLAFTLPPTTATGGGNRPIPAANASGAAGPSATNDPYIDRHAEVVARYPQGSPR